MKKATLSIICAVFCVVMLGVSYSTLKATCEPIMLFFMMLSGFGILASIGSLVEPIFTKGGEK